MAKLHKTLSLLTCIILIFSLCACSQNPAPTEPPTEPVATEPSAAEVYAEARANLDNATDISLKLQVNRTINVADQDFTEQSEQILTYTGIGTDDPRVSLQEILTSGKSDEGKDAEEAEDSSVTYREIYADGTVYASLEDVCFFSGAVAANEYTDRYIPVVLLDAALYTDMTSEATGTGTTIHFAAPSGPESWAIPEGAEMLESSGRVYVNLDGSIGEMAYVITYQYGPARITLDVTSTPQNDTAEIVVPEDAKDYPVLQYIDALRISTQAPSLLIQSNSVVASSLESITSQAAGVIRNASTAISIYGTGDDIMTKVDSGLYLMDYNTNQSQELDQEEIYRDGKYVVTVDDGVPTSQTGISPEDIEMYCDQILLSHFVSQEFWADVTASDLGSVLLLEFTYTEDFGNTIQNGICNVFWQDSAFLNKLASAYVTNEVSGYISIDKYTGIITSAGYCYKGTHTIDGSDYTLAMQSDQSIEAPGLGAYYEITEEIPEEAEPEATPTPLFYHVTGDDGQEMWLLGTIHVGDERTAYLPEEIYNAFAASDALALEIDSKAFEEQLEKDDALQDKVSSAYYYSNGKTIESMMEEADYKKAVQYMKATGNYNMNAPYAKPYLWSNSIDLFHLRQWYALHSNQGVEERLHKWAEDLGKEIREVESSLFQIQMSTGFSDELQLLMLEESMEYTAQEYNEETIDLYEKWCQGDEFVLREAINEDPDTTEMTDAEFAEYESQLPLMEEYDKAMSYDRNEDMLKVAVKYLESDETVFYAVGLAHLLYDENGLVDTLREAGYTVEQVKYAK